MTFSVLKSTPSNELSSPTKNVKGEGQSDEAVSGEDKSSSIFSQLFSAFSSDKSSEGKISGKQGESASGDLETNGVDVELEGAEAALGNESTDGLVLDGLTKIDSSAIASNLDVEGDEGDEGESNAENSDALLTRLGKSEQLLQGNPKASISASDTSIQAIPDAENLNPEALDKINAESGNLLPLSEQNNKMIHGDVSDSGTQIDEVATLTNAAMSMNSPKGTRLDIESDKPNSSPAKKLADVLNSLSKETNEIVSDGIPADAVIPMSALTSAALVNEAQPKEQVLSQFVNAQASDDKQGELGNDKRFNPAGANVANSANSITAAMAGNNSGSGFDLNTPAANDLEQVDSLMTETTEQADFNQTLETVRRQEQADVTNRAQAKTPVLTEAEQQILDKRVNINHASASSELNEKIAIMAGKELQTATIRLDPSEMGSMNIKLSMQNDQATVVIHAQNAQSRELLEQQLPRLREMLQQQGIALGDTQVQADSGSQQQSAFQQGDDGHRPQSGEKASNNTTNYAADSQTETAVSSEYWQDSGKGVDFYA